MKILGLVLVLAVALVIGISLSHAEYKEVADGLYMIVDDAEIDINGGPDGTVDFGSGGGSDVKVSSDNNIKHEGKKSIKVDYDAVPDGYMWIARGKGLDASNADWSNHDIDWSQYNAISVYIHGEGKGAKIAFDVKDSGGEIWRYIFNDDFNGWEQIIAPFNEFYPRSDWQPESADNNATMDFPLMSYQFEPLPPAKGTFHYDHVQVIKQ